MIRATGDIDRVVGNAAVVRAKTMSSGTVEARGHAGTVEEGGQFDVVTIDHIGRPGQQ
jgi:hypothetical protein